MKTADFGGMLARMAELDLRAFAEFDDAMRGPILAWLTEFGMTEADIAVEAPRCLFALGIMTVQRRAEIDSERFLPWCRSQTRNMVVRYWREVDDRCAPPATLTARRVRDLAMSLDGTRKAYGQAARASGVPADWLRRRHRSFVLGLLPGACIETA